MNPEHGRVAAGGYVPMGTYSLTNCTSGGGQETPKQLRKRAKRLEKETALDKAALKAQRKADKKRAREEKAARAALVAVAADDTKAYARVWAARSILGLDN